MCLYVTKLATWMTLFLKQIPKLLTLKVKASALKVKHHPLKIYAHILLYVSLNFFIRSNFPPNKLSFRDFVIQQQQIQYHVMTSSNGNIFRVTGPLCGEFTGHRWMNGYVNNREAGNLRRHRAHCYVTVMKQLLTTLAAALDQVKSIPLNYSGTLCIFHN